MAVKKAIVDLDSLLYKVASVNEEVYEFDDTVVSTTDLQSAKELLDFKLDEILDNSFCNDFELYLSDKTCFRYKILPTYKANRQNLKRPQLLQDLKDYAINKYKAVQVANLEADDLCCIAFTTNPKNKVLVHIDKDLNQVAGEHYNYNSTLSYEVTPPQALRVFYKQILVGDSADNYKGCPGVGVVGAKKIIDNYQGYKLVNDKWIECKFKSLWSAIVSNFYKAYYKDIQDFKTIEKIALQQARVSYILKAGDYKNGKVKLWRPQSLKYNLKNEIDI